MASKTNLMSLSSRIKFFILFCCAIKGSIVLCNDFTNVVTNFTVQLTKSRDVVYFGCQKLSFMGLTRAFLHHNKFVRAVNIGKSFTLTEVLTRHNHARTAVIVDCECSESLMLLRTASEMRFLNKTYQWLLWDTKPVGLGILLPDELSYPGLNSQVTHVTKNVSQYTLWDVHSKGRHLKSPLELLEIATFDSEKGFTVLRDFDAVQGIKFRDQFNGLTLRGATVIDQDNIINNEQIEAILGNPRKDAGVATFVKYHYELLNILRDRLNFTVNYRNSRGWAGRLQNTGFRLGFLGVLQRNEADVGASGAFNRLNRFAEFDIIHQSWKFETGFLYRFTPDLDTHGKSGNFLAPFDDQVWIFSTVSLCAMNCIWRLVEWINEMWRWRTRQRKKQQSQQQQRHQRQQRQQIQTQSNEVVNANVGFEEAHSNEQEKIASKISFTDSETSWSGLSLKTFAAICQQGMDPIPKGLPSRTIVLTVFLYSVVMYNYYTSSVVGGLLSSTAQGPASVDEVVSSPLKLSFEDIGYYKVLFRERQNKSLTVQRLYDVKVLPSRSPSDMPVYLSVDNAIPYLKSGGYAFHCEVLDAYPQIARKFDADEICDLRMVAGLMETEIVNWDITKQSQYSEVFRIVMCRATEIGLVKRTLRLRRPRMPRCQALYRVFPIAMSGVSSAFMVLGGGFMSGLIILLVERKTFQMQKKRNQKK